MPSLILEIKKEIKHNIILSISYLLLFFSCFDILEICYASTQNCAAGTYTENDIHLTGLFCGTSLHEFYFKSSTVSSGKPVWVAETESGTK